MGRHYSKEMLRRMRNDIPIDKVIEQDLDISCKRSEGYFRFCCPLCRDFHTATNPKTNLARCFRCNQNFNPIDIVMTVKKWSFRQTADYLLKKL